jgi:SPP1 gp7 family putative phage head morphogenesis protein
MADFLFGPVPHDEAIDYIARKPVVARAVFDRLLPELKARAFVVTGVDAADAVQNIRDCIAKLPAGATWDSVKKDIAAKVSVHFIDPAADAKEQDAQINASNRRAELLLRTHGFQAYQTASWSQMSEQKDVLPCWQYVTMGDGRVRPSHAALGGIVLPADSPFWQRHFPPWGWGCRCQCVPLSKPDVEEIKTADAKKPADQQRVLEGPLLSELEQNNRLVRGPNQIVSVAPQEGPGAYAWTPEARGLSVEQLRGRYDADIFDDFEQWAKATQISEQKTVWEWVGGAPVPPIVPPVPPVPSAPPKPPVAPPAPPPVPLPKLPPQPPVQPAPPQSVAELLGSLGLDASKFALPSHMAALQKALVKSSPASASQLISSISGATGHVNITSQKLKTLVQGFVDMLPSEVASKLPAFSLIVEADLGSLLGNYSESLRELRLSAAQLDADPQGLHKTLWHEMIHWTHDHGPAEYRARITALLSARTNGFTEKLEQLKPWNTPDILGWEDDFLDMNGDAYAGRLYSWEDAKNPRGYEIATRHLEKLALPPETLARHWNYRSKKSNRYPWREAFIDCLHLFYPLPKPPTASAPSAPSSSTPSKWQPRTTRIMPIDII